MKVFRVHRNVQRFRGGLVFKTHRLGVSLNSRLESNKEEEEVSGSAREGGLAESKSVFNSAVTGDFGNLFFVYEGMYDSG